MKLTLAYQNAWAAFLRSWIMHVEISERGLGMIYLVGRSQVVHDTHTIQESVHMGRPAFRGVKSHIE